MNLYFLKNYNNYFNRIVKPLTGIYTLEDFENSVILSEGVQAAYITNVAFNYNDHLETTQIINWSEDWSPDYMLLVTDGGAIESTWFVMDSYYTRNGQFNVVLRRDIVNDHFDEVINAPCYVEKATINDVLNPLLYNSEGMQFNQIKTEEHKLFDETGCGWVVGYVAKPAAEEQDTPINTNVNVDFDYTKAAINNMLGRKWAKPSLIKIDVAVATGGIGIFRNTDYYKTFTFSNLITIENTSSNNNNLGAFTVIDYFQTEQQVKEGFEEPFKNAMLEILPNLTSDFPLGRDLQALAGKVVYDSEESKYYKIRVDKSIEELPVTTRHFANRSNAIDIAFQHALSQTNYYGDTGDTNNDFLGQLTLVQDAYDISLEEMPTGNITTKISAGRTPLLDAPYDMFAIPYGKITVTQNTSSATPLGYTNQEAAINIAHEISEQLGTKLYDIQLLPYCPYNLNSDTLYLTGLDENIDYNLATSGAEGQGLKLESIILWCKQSSGSKTINFVHDIADAKIENECEMWRLVSPNQQGIFEFNAARNYGIQYLVAEYTYKPYNPYIHVAPHWDGLYGKNFGDARGLICGGDFSLPQVSDAFKQYEINNKNYQNIFDRGIQNLDYNRKYERINDYVGAVAGSVQASAMGFAIGGGWGAAAGGAASLAAGLGDAAINEALYKENKDYQTDLYNFNLGNVKAMPDSLTKASALTINNKVVPVLERYTCTEFEKKALQNKLKFNGMTVMAIGSLIDYLTPFEQYVQGQIIRIDNIEDNHIATAIYNEIKKGIFTSYTKSEDDR